MDRDRPDATATARALIEALPHLADRAGAAGLATSAYLLRQVVAEARRVVEEAERQAVRRSASTVEALRRLGD